MASESKSMATERVEARPNAATDDELVDRAIRGEEEAFEALVIRYQDRVYNLLLRLTGSGQDAEDLAQETFLKAYRAISRFRRGSKFYTWLFRIAVNAGYSRGRKQACRQRVEGVRLDAPARSGEDDGATALSDRMASPAADPAEALAQRQLRERVQEGLAQLDEEYRSVILLRDMDGMDYDAIAEALNITYAAVKSRLHRARLELASVLRDLKPERQS